MEKAKNIFINYFKDKEKTRDDLMLGPEFEHIIVDRKTYKSVSYYGDRGVEYIFGRLVEKGFQAEYEEGHILGLSLDDMHLATEPGGQVELSIDKKETVMEIEKSYRRFFSILLPILDEEDYDILAIAYHPITKIEEIKLLPKYRYRTMFEHFKSHGSMSHNMMKGTAGLQLSIDYVSEEDFKKKFFLANAIGNILYSIFDNGYFFEGQPTHHNIRALIWANTDQDRAGLAKNLFVDNSYEGYGDYLAKTPALFAYVDGSLQATGDKLIGDLVDENSSKEEIDHLLTMVFPDIRQKGYIEIRTMDAAPYPYNMGIFALIKGIFYNEMNLDLLYRIFADVNQDDLDRLREDMYIRGNESMFLERSLKAWSLAFIDMAKGALSPEEGAYLDPLKDLILSQSSFYDKTERLYKETGDIKKSVEFTKISL
ncbi:MAG: glutamate-cysteine ligase family protein [Bacillota bacterium]|nr:glutamate-cysteine ligase family protein [Bacillota bacterium]